MTTTIGGLDAATALALTDLVELETDPSGTPASEKATLGQISDLFAAAPAFTSQYAPLSARALAIAAGDMNRALVWDAFQRPNGSSVLLADSGHTWDGISAGASVFSNRWAPNVGATISSDVGTASASVETCSTNGNVGPVVLIDNDNYLSWRRQFADTFRLSKTDGGVTSALVNVTRAHPVGATWRLGIKKVGNSVSLYLDGEFVGSHTLAGGDATKFGSVTRFGARQLATVNDSLYHVIIRREGTP